MLGNRESEQGDILNSRGRIGLREIGLHQIGPQWVGLLLNIAAYITSGEPVAGNPFARMSHLLEYSMGSNSVYSKEPIAQMRSTIYLQFFQMNLLFVWTLRLNLTVQMNNKSILKRCI